MMETQKIRKEREYREYRKEIEKLTQLWCEEILFDTDKNDWYSGTSEFNEKIKNKEKLIISIEDTNDNIFGCFINDKISEKNYYLDKKSFIFSFNKNANKKIQKCLFIFQKCLKVNLISSFQFLLPPNSFNNLEDYFSKPSLVFTYISFLFYLSCSYFSRKKFKV